MIINQTLNWLRFKDSTFAMESINTNELINEVIHATQFEYPNINITVDGILMPLINGNDFLLKSALTNVLRNASRFAETIVTISFSKNTNDTITITIYDDGRGVPENKISHIFEPFAQADHVRKPEASKGSGLGLAIAKQSIERHGGKISASNNVKGFTLYIALPIE